MSAIQQVRLALAANVPALVWGEPGTGKTEMVAALARDLFGSLPVEVVIASQREVTDANGLPTITDDGVFLVPPAYIKRVVKAGGGVIVLDELTTAPRGTQAAFLRLINERVCGDLALPPEVRIVALANPPETAAGGYVLAAPTANRFTHINWTAPTAPEWTEWAMAKWGGDPEGLRAASLLAGFLTANPKALFMLPDDEDAQGKAWPSPRTWELALKGYRQAVLAKMEDEVGPDMVAAAVGPQVGAAFATFRRAFGLPDPRALLDGRASFTFDLTRIDAAAAVLVSTATEATRGKAASAKEREALVDAAWGLVLAATKAGCKDYCGPALKALTTWRYLPAAKGGSGKPGDEGVNEALAHKSFADALKALREAVAGKSA